MFDLEDRLWWYEGMRAVTASLLNDELRDKQSPRILDVGCGTGYSLAWLRERLKTESVFGVDVSPDAAKFWQSRGLEAGAIASAYALPFSHDEFDLATCFDVIYQLSSEEQYAALAEMRRVLKPAGLLFIREPAYDWMRGAHDLAIGTRHRFTLGELRSLLLSQGFVPRRTTYANTLLFGAAVVHRLLSRLNGNSSSDVKPVPEWVNRTFHSVLKIEARLLRQLRFPFGLSVIAVAEKVR